MIVWKKKRRRKNVTKKEEENRPQFIWPLIKSSANKRMNGRPWKRAASEEAGEEQSYRNMLPGLMSHRGASMRRSFVQLAVESSDDDVSDEGSSSGSESD